MISNFAPAVPSVPYAPTYAEWKTRRDLCPFVNRRIPMMTVNSPRVTDVSFALTFGTLAPGTRLSGFNGQEANEKGATLLNANATVSGIFSVYVKSELPPHLPKDRVG
jgi:hypothetical protein